MIQGIFQILAAEYHASDSLSAGVARRLVERSPAHAKYEREHGSEDTKESDRGTVAHALLLQGEDIMRVLPYEDWRTKQARTDRDECRATDKIAILEKDVGPIKAMVAAAKKAWDECPDLEGYRHADGIAEQSIFWQESEIWMRCRPDWWSNDHRVVIDCKFTAVSANPETFARQVISMGFDLRAALYLRGARAMGAKSPKYVYLLQEVEPPYCTSFVGIPPAMLELGELKLDYAIKRWRECTASGIWPGYDQRIHYAEPEPWMLKQWGLEE